jgi:hypothetical protein
MCNTEDLQRFLICKEFQSQKHRVHTELQWPISDVHSIVMEKAALAGEGGGARPPPFILSSSRTKLQCTLQLRGQILPLYFISTPIRTLWSEVSKGSGGGRQSASLPMIVTISFLYSKRLLLTPLNPCLRSLTAYHSYQNVSAAGSEPILYNLPTPPRPYKTYATYFGWFEIIGKVGLRRNHKVKLCISWTKWETCKSAWRIYTVFLNLHTTSAKQELTAGPAKLHSQIFYCTTGGFIYNHIHALNRRSLQTRD